MNPEEIVQNIARFNEYTAEMNKQEWRGHSADELQNRIWWCEDMMRDLESRITEPGAMDAYVAVRIHVAMLRSWHRTALW